MNKAIKAGFNHSPLSDDGIRQLRKAQKFDEADKAIRERMKAAGMSDKQVSGLMMYAYDQGHAYGEDEVLGNAMGLMNAIEGNF